MRRPARPYDADVLVVGSGFGGAVSALRLAEKGYEVVVLERGRRYRTEDFPRTSWSLRKYLWAPRLGLHGIQALTPLRDALVLHGCGVGGGSLVYANTLLVPGEEAFDPGTWGSPGWRERLAPHYREAARMLGAAPCQGVGRADELLREIGLELRGEDTFRTHDVGVYFGEPGVEVPDPYFGGAGPPRTGCTRCAACMVGCRVGAKNTLDKNYLWLAERLGARIVPETEALAVRRTEGGYVVETRASTGIVRRRHRWRARRVVLSAGVLGTVELLQRSRRSGGLPLLSPRLGRGVRTNSEALLAADAPAGGTDWADHVAITSGIRADADTYVELVRFNRGSDALFWLAVPMVDGGGAGWMRALAAMARRPKQALRSVWPFGRAARTQIVLAMQATGGDFSLELRRSWHSLGRRALVSVRSAGRPRPVTHIPVADEVTRRLAARMGGDPWRTAPVALFGAPTTAHILGGCAMGSTPETGVVDEHGQVHGYPGLHVADGSIVPGNLGVNPALTITALAEYVMSHVPES